MTATIESQMHGDYPMHWDEFIGQEKAKRKLRTAAGSARMRNAQMEHTLLLSGTPGIGKTSLAILTARELGHRIRVLSGAIKAADARVALADLEDGDVLFIDEIHQVFAGSKVNGEWLLHLLQDGVIMGPRGAEEQPKITVLAATTHGGVLPETVLERFSLTNLEAYTDEEANQIARALSLRVMGEHNDPLPRPSDRNCAEIARASSNSPRVMRKLWVTCRDVAMTSHGGNWDGTDYDMTEVLDWHGLSPDGLTKGCRDYMRVLMQDFSGGAGLKALQDRLQEPGGLGHTERLLQQKGYLALTGRGRVLTQPGLRRTKQLNREEEQVA
jgi:Holliday junction DNA helicase RuvB